MSGSTSSSDEAPAAATPSADDDWRYTGTPAPLLLAPMVRVNTLPFRLLAAEHGAHMVYSEELVDRSVSSCTRRVNAALNTIEFVRPGSDSSRPQLIFSTKPHERVAFQLGTADAAEALRAARVVADDVRAIDVNMGCPVKFSLQGGMGSALLTQPEKVRDILTTLVRNLGGKPVTCKIRLLESPAETLQLCRAIAECGVAALAVHARRRHDRPRHWAQWDQVALLRDALPKSLPLVLNGDVFSPEDVPRALAADGRGARSCRTRRDAAGGRSAAAALPRRRHLRPHRRRARRPHARPPRLRGAALLAGERPRPGAPGPRAAGAVVGGGGGRAAAAARAERAGAGLAARGCVRCGTGRSGRRPRRREPP